MGGSFLKSDPAKLRNGKVALRSNVPRGDRGLDIEDIGNGLGQGSGGSLNYPGGMALSGPASVLYGASTLSFHD